MLQIVMLAVFPGVMIYAAVSDLLTMTIPNRISLILFSSFFLGAFLLNLSWNEIGMHVLSSMLMLVLCLFFFTMRWMGGGDAKLATCIALWFGFDQLLDFSMLTAMAGGILTLFLVLFHVVEIPKWARSQVWIVRLHELKSGIPYGIALATAALLLYPKSTMWKNFIEIVADKAS